MFVHYCDHGRLSVNSMALSSYMVRLKSMIYIKYDRLLILCYFSLHLYYYVCRLAIIFHIRLLTTGKRNFWA